METERNMNKVTIRQIYPFGISEMRISIAPDRAPQMLLSPGLEALTGKDSDTGCAQYQLPS